MPRRGIDVCAGSRTPLPPNWLAEGWEEVERDPGPGIDSGLSRLPSSWDTVACAGVNARVTEQATPVSSPRSQRSQKHRNSRKALRQTPHSCLPRISRLILTFGSDSVPRCLASSRLLAASPPTSSSAPQPR